MKLLSNTGNERVVDELRSLAEGASLSAASTAFSIFGFSALHAQLRSLRAFRLLIPQAEVERFVLGESADRSLRNQLKTKWLAAECLAFLQSKGQIAELPAPLLQSVLILADPNLGLLKAINGDCSITTSGLGLSPYEGVSLIQSADTPAEAQMLDQWFSKLWERGHRTTGAHRLSASSFSR